MLKGIDVSEHQGIINWDLVKNQINFAIIRAGYGQGNIDKQFIRNIKECTRLKIPVGVYWFSYAYTKQMSREEAQYCLNAIKNYKIEYPVCFDFEYDTVRYAKTKGIKVTRELASKIVITFCEEIEKAGYYAMNYSNQDYCNNMFNSDVNKYDLWYAWYNTSCNHKCGIWQYTNKGNVLGINGPVDMNYAYKNYPNIIEKGRYDMDTLVTYYGDADLFAAVLVAQKNRCAIMKFSDYEASGLKVKNVIQIGGKAGSTRFTTFKDAAKLV